MKGLLRTYDQKPLSYRPHYGHPCHTLSLPPMELGGGGWLTHVQHVLVALNAVWQNPPIILPPIGDRLMDA